MHNAINTIIVPYAQDILSISSNHIIENHKHLLPNLSSITVFLANKLAQTQLQNNLLEYASNHKHSTILLPHCTTLKQWALESYLPRIPVLSIYARELILVDALHKQPGLFANSNPWAIASELFTLFDEMTLNNINLKNIDDYTSNYSQNIPQAISQEAELIMVLWQAWQKQISQEQVLDPVDVYARALRVRASHTVRENAIYCIGLDELASQEIALLNKLHQQTKLYTYIYASNKHISSRPDIAIKKLIDNRACEDLVGNSTAYSKFLDAVFLDCNFNIKERAETFYKEHPTSPINKRLKIFKTDSLDFHVKALDIKIRNSIYQGSNNIGVITADRKLVRRLRAVLEHANILVNDLGGWALSTTSVASYFEQWIRLIEENFPAKLFVAIAKSPFYPVNIDKNFHNKAINFLEKEIILTFNLHNDLNTIREKVEEAHNNQQDDNELIFGYLYQILDKFDSSTHIIRKLYNNLSPIPLHHYFEALLNSLKSFGAYSILKNDDVGKQCIDLFKTQISHFAHIENNVSWLEWRRFLTRILDQQNYKPPLINSSVTFFSLDQSRLLNFDTIIIASVDKDHFPGSTTNYVFFNESVRSELGVPTWRNKHAIHFYRFRTLLEAAQDILISVQTEQNGEKTTPCPWLAAIETFHRMAYAEDLSDTNLNALCTQNNNEVIHPQNIPFVSPLQMPAPRLKKKLSPGSISISEYQTLIKCPYKFFAATCLKLSKTNELKEEIDKADFGSIVHKCIHTFNTTTQPLNSRITNKNRKDAESKLNALSKKIFKQQSKQGLNNELWLKRWLYLIPSFIDWEIKRQENFSPYKHEIPMHKNINNKITIKGRADRIDKFKDNYAIIDYKTGQTPTQKSILIGEEVQLPMYAYLSENCSQVEFVSIGKNNTVKSESIIKGKQLEELINQHAKRLNEIEESLSNEIQLAAHAEDNICERCEYKGLCRKGHWEM